MDEDINQITKDKQNQLNAAFEIDRRVCLYIEHELAVSLGKLVLESETKNTALLALGHQLRKLANGR